MASRFENQDRDRCIVNETYLGVVLEDRRIKRNCGTCENLRELLCHYEVFIFGIF